MPGRCAVANWVAHVNGVNPSPTMRAWLTGRASLTAKLTGRCAQFRVQRLVQRRAVCLADEYAPIGLPYPRQVLEREVLLQCDGQPMVFAHTIVPLEATATQWPLFRSLGERSLGTTLFGDPGVLRGTLEYARLHPSHPLARRACAAVAILQALDAPLFARRCLFRRHGGVLLVTELFLPAIATL
ncbi:MAG: chorismate lyase [Glaciimonas sp.]|nr:chorismate lyase [Glaciimonas sp.]